MGRNTTMSNTFYNGRKWVSGVGDLPEGDLFMIVEFGSMTIPGDERSRTHPGHGYPAETVTTTNITVYETRQAWEVEIDRRTRDTSPYRSSWVPIAGRRPSITTTVKVEVK